MQGARRERGCRQNEGVGNKSTGEHRRVRARGMGEGAGEPRARAEQGHIGEGMSVGKARWAERGC